jgi:hypothetical protein
MIPLLPDLGKLSDVRLTILYGQKLAAIERAVRDIPDLRRLAAQADKVEDEIRRREFERDRRKAP